MKSFKARMAVLLAAWFLMVLGLSLEFRNWSPVIGTAIAYVFVPIIFWVGRAAP